METLIFLDTHIVVAIAAGKSSELSKPAIRMLDRAQAICVSPLVALELEFLWEIRRIRMQPALLLQEAARTLDVRTRDASLGEIAEAAAAYAWTRDPFDRMIVAQAALEGAPLVSKDENILAHYKRAIW